MALMIVPIGLYQPILGMNTRSRLLIHNEQTQLETIGVMRGGQGVQVLIGLDGRVQRFYSHFCCTTQIFGCEHWRLLRRSG